MRHRLSRNGGYERWIPGADGESLRGEIFRRKCSRCQTSFSLLPEDVLPRYRHGRDRVAGWLWRSLGGDSYRSRPFYEEEVGIRQPQDDPASWTDFIDGRSPAVQPAPSRLRSWSRSANRGALAWLGPLAVACLAGGCRLQSGLQAVMEPLAGAPARCAPLALALGLFAWLRNAPPSLDLMKALLPLLSRPCRQASHKTYRAATPHSGYAAKCLDLRAPPAWVQAIPPGGGQQG